MEDAQHETHSRDEDLTSEGAFTIDGACAFSSLGRSTIYQLARDGRLATTRVGRRRLVLRASLRRLLAEGVEADSGV